MTAKKEHSDLVKEHFEIKYYDYDNLIRKLIPQYEQMHGAVIECVDIPEQESHTLLDLGVGTGETALRLLEKFPQAKIDGFDISPKMLEQGKERLKEKGTQITFTEQDIKNLELSDKMYDACVAVLSVHHLNAQQKQTLFRKIYDHLKQVESLCWEILLNSIPKKKLKKGRRMEEFPIQHPWCYRGAVLV